MTIQISVNGSVEHYESGVSLVEILGKRDISPDTARGIAVAVNDEIVRRSDWESTMLKPGSLVEIVTARQGG
ncbi:MAG: sulfur carrier protein ThiS [Bacteroidetes bacterium]|nr:sulfur carrier protein ThiS [Bacteroidota bacterium]